jgi:acyl carrier protein
MSESTRERVVEVLRRVLGPEVDLEQTRLELESLKMLEVIVSLENEFEISIPEDAPLVRVTSSVDKLVAYLKTIKKHS